MKIKKSKGSLIFDVLNYSILTLVSVLAMLPILYVISASLVTPEEMLAKKIVLIPTKITFSAYQYLLSSNVIVKSIGVSIFITVIGTAINMFMTVLTAYPISKKYMRGNKFFMLMIVFTMLFNGGMIPTYLVVTALKLTNTYWALWLPGAISAFNLILAKNFFHQLPAEIEEAAKIDGCNEFGILFKIVLPLSTPILATLTLFYAVSNWNSWFSSLLYISDMNKWPIMIWLRQIVLLSSGGFSDATAVSDAVYVPPQSINYATIVFATIPVLLVYPFLQKYFAKGALVGGVKG
jgi:putative aldouronate transport system permease protein